MLSEFVVSQDEPGGRNQDPPLSKEEQAQISAIKDLEAEFLSLCRSLGSSRELSLAITAVETAAWRAQRHVIAKRQNAAQGEDGTAPRPVRPV